jgi:hypothetical protein
VTRRRPRARRTVLAGAVTTVALVCGLAGPLGAAGASVSDPVPGSSSGPTDYPGLTRGFLGGYAPNDGWYDANVGLPQIYRSYDSGFHYRTWQETAAYAQHGNTLEDYSFKIPPAQLASGAYDDRLRVFIASTPRNFIFTNYHEPEQEIAAGLFTAADYRAAIVRLAQIVHAQNALDQGTRRVAVTLMADTVVGFKGRNPLDYWPGVDPSSGRNYADVLSFDTYARPHATSTTGVPAGYTDGLKWLTSAQLLDPGIAVAQRLGTPWMISEFGFLEDVHDPTHKARAIQDFVEYAFIHGAIGVEYWDGVGSRGDWRLSHSAQATAMWSALVGSD